MNRKNLLLKLSEPWATFAENLPETGMSYTVATVYLKDGRVFKQVVIFPPYIAEIRGLREIPFSVEEIEKIVATHDKWNYDEAHHDAEIERMRLKLKEEGW